MALSWLRRVEQADAADERGLESKSRSQLIR